MEGPLGRTRLTPLPLQCARESSAFHAADSRRRWNSWWGYSWLSKLSPHDNRGFIDNVLAGRPSVKLYRRGDLFSRKANAVDGGQSQLPCLALIGTPIHR